MEAKDAEHEILSFIRKELDGRGKKVELGPHTPILSTRLLDSLFLVDLIVFLEDKYASRSSLLAKATKTDLDSVAKIISFLGL